MSKEPIDELQPEESHEIEQNVDIVRTSEDELELNKIFLRHILNYVKVKNLLQAPFSGVALIAVLILNALQALPKGFRGNVIDLSGSEQSILAQHLFLLIGVILFVWKLTKTTSQLEKLKSENCAVRSESLLIRDEKEKLVAEYEQFKGLSAKEELKTLAEIYPFIKHLSFFIDEHDAYLYKARESHISGVGGGLAKLDDITREYIGDSIQDRFSCVIASPRYFMKEEDMAVRTREDEMTYYFLGFAQKHEKHTLERIFTAPFINGIFHNVARLNSNEPNEEKHSSRFLSGNDYLERLLSYVFANVLSGAMTKVHRVNIQDSKIEESGRDKFKESFNYMPFADYVLVSENEDFETAKQVYITNTDANDGPNIVTSKDKFLLACYAKDFEERKKEENEFSVSLTAETISLSEELKISKQKLMSLFRMLNISYFDGCVKDKSIVRKAYDNNLEIITSRFETSTLARKALESRLDTLKHALNIFDD